MLPLLLLLPGTLAHAQDSLQLQLLTEIPGHYTFLTTDPLQQVYAVTENQDLVKFDKTGREQFRYSNFTLGRLGQVDVTNPFSLLLYYPDFQAVALLDRTLNQVGRLNLIDLDLPDTRAIALDSENFIWLYDPLSFQLKRLDTRGQVKQQSENLALSLPQTPTPHFLAARDNRLFLADAEQGVFWFDNFGRLEKILPVYHPGRFQVREQQLIYFQEGRLNLLQLSTLELQQATLPAALQKATTLRLEQDLLYALFEAAIRVYRIQGN